MTAKRPVVDGEPRLLVLARPERAGGEAGVHVLDRQLAPHLEQVAAAPADRPLRRRRRRPEWASGSTRARDRHPVRRSRQGRPARDRLEGRNRAAPCGMHDVLDGPAPRLAPADLRIADQTVVVGLSRDEAGKPGASALDEVEPLVLAKSSMAVGGRSDIEQAGERSDIGLAHTAFDLDVVHHAPYPPRVLRPMGACLGRSEATPPAGRRLARYARSGGHETQEIGQCGALAFRFSLAGLAWGTKTTA